MRALVTAAESGQEVQENGEKVLEINVWMKACYIAKDAAPYVHPRLQAIEHNGKLTVRSLAEELAELNAKRNAEGSK